MSDETPTVTEEKPRTPTELLMAVFENVENMEQVMVIFRLKKDADGNGGMGWASEFKSLHGKLAFIEEAKLSMYHAVYGCKTE
jgi:hypothetical protein